MTTYIFIDGTNLYAAQYELFGPKKYLNFSKLIERIELRLKIKFDKIYFYASYSPKSEKPSQKEKLYLKNEALFYRNVKQIKNIVFFTGYRSKTSGKEKEVDVKLPADLITFAFLKKYNRLFLLTGDADFLQALFSVRKYHKDIKINLICIENKIMYQGLFYFRTYLFIFKKKPILRRKFDTLEEINFNSKNLFIDIKNL